jgi:hypothetical protein
MLGNLGPIIHSKIEHIIEQINIFIKNNNYDDSKVYNLINEQDIKKVLKNTTDYILQAQHINMFAKKEIDDIQEVISKINDQINIIEYRLKYNKSLWVLSSFRKYQFNNRINELNIQLIVLLNRVITLNSYTTLNNLINYNSTKLGDTLE